MEPIDTDKLTHSRTQAHIHTYIYFHVSARVYVYRIRVDVVLAKMLVVVFGENISLFCTTTRAPLYPRGSPLRTYRRCIHVLERNSAWLSRSSRALEQVQLGVAKGAMFCSLQPLCSRRNEECNMNFLLLGADLAEWFRSHA
jgi:hypothetical protein